ncbi:MAG: hypothetical protein J6B43_10605 [Lachnospiraceae bacterium]|nr:hypothetical protein [Lachnospiraceae bacterium]
MIINMFGFDSQAQQNELADWETIGVYPINVYDEEWADMTFAERLQALALPEELVDSLSTEDLAEWALAYPYLGARVLHDSAKGYMDFLLRNSYLFRSLFAREDANEVLLNKFDDLKVNYNMLINQNTAGSDTFTESGYVKELFLQSYFATVIDELSVTEKAALRDILEEKYIAKSGICQNFTTATLFYADVLSEYGEIPAELLISTDIVIDEAAIGNDISDPTSIDSDGFTNSGQIATYNGGNYYVGTYSKYGVSVNCYKFCSGELSSAEATDYENLISTLYPSWEKVTSATRKFNCHSYAWIEQSTSNVYWLINPNAFATSSSFRYIGANGGANKGDHIIIINSYGESEHSLISTSTGTNSNSINTISKCGSAGIYRAVLADIILEYGNEYKVYR